MDWSVDPADPTPPSRQLGARVLDALATGALRSGDRLPSVRALAAEARVNHNTVARSYRDLEALGVVRGWNGRGVFVTSSAGEIARRERRRSTREQLDRAARAALRAGHGREELHEVIRRLASELEERDESA